MSGDDARLAGPETLLAGPAKRGAVDAVNGEWMSTELDLLVTASAVQGG
jgi:hypothetical protein